MPQKLLRHWSALVRNVLHLPKSLYFNLRFLSPQAAIRLPILVHRKTKLLDLSGKVTIEGSLTPAMITIGFPRVIICPWDKPTLLQLSGELVFKGRAHIGRGCTIAVGPNGKLVLGDQFSVTSSSSIICHKSIVFGKGDLLSWEIFVTDTDFHTVLFEGEPLPKTAEIRVSDHVWIGMRCTLLKGAYVPPNSVVAAGSLITDDYLKALGGNVIVGGRPARVLKSGVDWRLI
jgi:acetyltransferase-like isoleucine patch superfamily enzyme